MLLPPVTRAFRGGRVVPYRGDCLDLWLNGAVPSSPHPTRYWETQILNLREQLDRLQELALQVPGHHHQ